MSFHHMFKYYGRALKKTNATMAEQMCEVAEYCIIDAISCQRLMVKHNAINEYRKVASVAFISLYDSHYFAVGIKVHNLLSARAWQEGILTSTIPCEQMEIEKYPGAYVFLPVKGLKNRRPVTGLDFASLYPSLINNLLPNKIILSREHAESLKESGKKLHKINFKFNGHDVFACSIEHENQAKMKGLYPKVLEESLIRCNSLKSRLAPLKDKKEELKKEISLAEARGGDNTNALKSEYSLVCFNVACLDAKQLALKVYMNMFYGEAENNGCSFFLRALAGGVKLAEEYFWECDEKYISEKILKEKYWEEMMGISMKVMEESIRLDNDNTRTLHQIVEDVLKETINDISQIDLNGMVKTAMWKPDKNNKSLTPEPYLYEIPEPGEHFDLKKLKDGNKVGDNKADDDGMDEDDLNEDEEDEDEMDEDEISKIRDALAQKSAEKWIRSVTVLTPEQFEEIRHLKNKVPVFMIVKEYHINKNHVHNIWNDCEHLQQNGNHFLEELKKVQSISSVSPSENNPQEKENNHPISGSLDDPFILASSARTIHFMKLLR
ncbi:hypothetical protein C1645_812689 [Glomus cerebriforme]|uniref:DNA-directed DNA polymerase n=1 Tax=Glomus cerebriforme TaxID=658196 RepID=A0A397TNE3_9GLOM|nr:hypothetical protein C1645_812689 [Glomus cerebriforme]